MTSPSATRDTTSDSGVSASARFHSLLVPVDLTPASDRVLGRVSWLPIAPDARVTLLHVVPESLTPVEQQQAERDAHKALVTEARHLQQRLPAKVTIAPLVKHGAAAAEIAACAAELEAELIVMGRGGGRVLRDIFLGSTAERVVRQTKKPVLVVRLPARASYARPALALDLDEAAHDVVRLMLRVLPPPRPRVDVIHAFRIPYQGMIYPSLTDDEAEERKSALRASVTQQLTGLLAAALASAKVAPEEEPYWKTHVRHGAPRVIIEKALKKIDADLLVLGTHGYSGAAFVFLGTVAGDLLRAAQCDVLIVPPARAA